MKKTLVISYTPRKNSNTKKLVDYFVEINADKTEISFVDLVKFPPDLLLRENLNLFVDRNSKGVTLNAKEQKILNHNDKMMQQVLDTDYIVVASPMYNFSLPATVKAWIDAIIQSGKTFTMTGMGPKGLCENKKALVLMTSGSDFAIEPLKSVNFATSLLSACFNFIGIPLESVNAFGLEQYPDELSKKLDKAKRKIQIVSKKWYSL
ncbi:NAD(P)H-dependent oxidoreductase [uncultured Aquimarina sp.]|uniref:FMN-dependent NADH-azoreductase n=1 Tax=uncultured Aquimarina sp. TaxID=575652 RepID=UPI00261C30CB|nr:NAD(P)H-dependent oxidoreductase [uncultured Aquimarina sp.]